MLEVLRQRCRRWGRLAVGLWLGSGWAVAGWAQPAAPADDDFQVNSYFTSSQFAPRVAPVADDGFVAVWMSRGSAGDDASQYSVQMRRFDADGVPLAADFQVNAYTTGQQQWPAVAADADGNFVVVWASSMSTGDADGGSIQARLFAASGAPLGGDFQVNSYTTGAQDYPAVAMASGGEFVVTWVSYGSPGTDQDSYSVLARRFDASGTPLAGDFQVNAYVTNTQDRPAVAALPGGGFVVTWMSSGSAGDDDASTSVQARLFDAAGAPANSGFQVNVYTPDSQLLPRVAAGGDGFVVTWVSNGSPGNDSSATSVQARRFAADGTPRGQQRQVDVFTTDQQLSPAVAVEADGDFTVVWESLQAPDSDAYRAIRARRFAADGGSLAGELQVNSHGAGAQLLPAVATTGDGTFAVVWNTFGLPGGDNASTGVAGRRFLPDADADGVPDEDDLCFGDETSGDGDTDGVCADLDCDDGNPAVAFRDACGVCGGTGVCALFSDDFESGDTSSWSATVGKR